MPIFPYRLLRARQTTAPGVRHPQQGRRHTTPRAGAAAAAGACRIPAAWMGVGTDEQSRRGHRHVLPSPHRPLRPRHLAIGISRSAATVPPTDPALPAHTQLASSVNPVLLYSTLLPRRIGTRGARIIIIMASGGLRHERAQIQSTPAQLLRLPAGGPDPQFHSLAARSTRTSSMAMDHGCSSCPHSIVSVPDPDLKCVLQPLKIAATAARYTYTTLAQSTVRAIFKI